VGSIPTSGTKLPYGSSGAASMRLRIMHRAVALSPLLVFLGVYGSAAGHGFISDDLLWLINFRHQHGRVVDQRPSD
jgi:hypothetical protein